MSVLFANSNSLKMPLAAASVDMCVTSPPYWGLRDYGTSAQLGLEPTPDEYVASMVAVFREVWRVMKDDGTLWLNIGDSYMSAKNTVPPPQTQGGQRGMPTSIPPNRRPQAGLKQKDLVGIPWMLAFALRADGWYLRSDIIWHKPNPMPESVTDRPTKSHEYLFLLAKSPKYYYDSDAIREKGVMVAGQSSGSPQRDTAITHGVGGGNSGINKAKEKLRDELSRNGFTMRNKRSVWTVTTKPYKGAHFATFPPDLIEPCIKAGCPEGGIVLDPFMGSGTTAWVARKLGRRAVGLDVSFSYLHEQARVRLGMDKDALL